jgi:hypothetical protein
MGLAEDTALLAKINTAIDAQLTSGATEEYVVGSGGGHQRHVRKTPLAELMKQRDLLTARISAATEGGSFNFAVRGEA